MLGDDDILTFEVDRRPMPDTDAWFETAWALFRNKEIYS